jgi:hypothetical protein
MRHTHRFFVFIALLAILGLAVACGPKTKPASEELPQLIAPGAGAASSRTSPAAKPAASGAAPGAVATTPSARTRCAR